jgi:hypothetical protein|nr:MAG TPA: DNA polymerase B [Caudoviricetes sp.]
MKTIHFLNDFTHLGEHVYKISREKYGRHYKNEPQNLTAYDIETNAGYRTPDGVAHAYNWEKAIKTDFYQKCEPVSIMWVWQCAVEDFADLDTIPVYLGRTWKDFKDFLTYYSDCVKLATAGRPANLKEPLRTHTLKTIKKSDIVLRLYIHNLGFEFQHLRNIFEAEFADENASVFARQMRKPMRVKFFFNGVEVFLCDTLCLTQKSLKAWGKDEKLEIQKLEEEQDFYQEIRTPYTKLSDEEIAYSVNDVATMICGLRRYRKKYGTLRSIPMTQTGGVRLVCMEKIAQQNPEWSERCGKITQDMTFEQYQELHAAFAGGWTHANARYARRTMRNLHMKDFRSSYPAVMCTRTFPVSSFEQTTYSDIQLLWKQDKNHRTHHYYIIFTAEGVQTKTQNTFWSSSKTTELEGEILDNGKIYACDKMSTTMTDLDFERFLSVYSHESLTVHKVMKAKAAHLPKEFVETILDYYEYKTSLKGIKEAESLYNESKQFINSIYGVCVTKVVSDIISYLLGWEKREAKEEDFHQSVEQQLRKSPFTTYAIGVWVTAWARSNLWDAIEHLDKKVVYCDTDSIKGLFTEDDEQWFDAYNAGIWKLCEESAQLLGIDVEKYRPKTQKGVYKELGFFDDEGIAATFRTLGAKRYVYTEEEDGEVHATIAGISKKCAAKKIPTADDFTLEVEWNVKESGKLSSHYCEDQPRTIWRDRDGNEYISEDRYGIVLEPAAFSLQAEDYMRFLELIDSGELNEYFEEPAIFR